MIRSWLLRNAYRAYDFQRAIPTSRADAIFVVDHHGRFTLVSRSAERLVGWTESELLGKTLHETIHRCGRTGQVAGEPCPLREAALGKMPFHRDDDCLRRRDGTVVPVTYMTAPVVIDGQIAGTAISFHNMAAHERELQEMRESEERYRYLAEASPDAMWLTDMYGYVITANAKAAELLGYGTWGQLLQTHFLELFVPDDRPRAVQDKRHTSRKEPRTGEYSLVRRDGSAFPAEVTVSPALRAEDQTRSLLYVVRDMSQSKAAEEEQLRADELSIGMEQAISEALASAAGMGDAIPAVLETICESGNWLVGSYWRIDEGEGVLRCHTIWHRPDARVSGFEALSRQLSVAPGIDLPGRAWDRNEPVWVSDVVTDGEILRALIASKEGLHAALCFPIVVGGAVQGVMEFFATDVRSPDAGMLQTGMWVSTELGLFLERKQAEQSLRHQALHDSLTGLPNRMLLQDRLQRALFVGRETGKPLALFLVDLDRFKQVNDARGHHYGDVLLQQVASRLQSVLRNSDTVARLGGDEFAVLLPGTEEKGARIVAEKLLETLREPFVVEGQMLEMGGSIGISLYPDHGEEAVLLLKAADAAMYVAKRTHSGYEVHRVEPVPPEKAPRPEAVSR